MNKQNPTTKRNKIPDPIQSLRKSSEAEASSEKAQQEENIAQLARINNLSIATLRNRASELYKNDPENRGPEQNMIEVQLRPESDTEPAIIATVGVVGAWRRHRQGKFVSVGFRTHRDGVDTETLSGFISGSFQGAPVFAEQIGTGREASFIQHSPVEDGTENDPDMTYYAVTEALALAAHEAETQQLAT